MNPWSLDLLEYESCAPSSARSIHSPLGRERLEALAPPLTAPNSKPPWTIVEEAIRYLRYAETPLRFSNIPDPTVILQKLRIEGALLEATEIYALTTLLDRARDARHGILDVAVPVPPPRQPRLRHRRLLAYPLRPLRQDPPRRHPHRRSQSYPCPPSAATVSASRKPSRTRSNRFLKAHGDDGVLQENFVTLRNDRFVVPPRPQPERAHSRRRPRLLRLRPKPSSSNPSKPSNSTTTLFASTTRNFAKSTASSAR